MRTQKLGVGFQFSKKACFVCGSFCHLIKDYDFHDKKMIQKPVLKTMEKGSGQREVRPVYNHAMRVNHQNFSNSRRNFGPTSVLIKSEIVPISTARQSSSRVAGPVSTARPINTTSPKPIVNETSPFSQTIKNMMEDLLLLQSFLKEMCDKKNSVLFTETEYLILSPDLKLPDGNQVFLKNRVLVIKPHNKTPYELLVGRSPIISFMRPFGCPVTILNTLDHLGKFDGKANEGFLVGYTINSKAFRVYNSITKKVEENLHVNFLENKPNVAGSGLKIHSDVGQVRKKKVSDQEYILLPLLNTCLDVPSCNEGVKSSPKDNAGKNPTVNTGSDKDGTFQRTYGEWNFSTPIPVNAASSSFSHPAALDDFSKMPDLEDTGIFDDAYDDRDEGKETDYKKLETMEPKKVSQALDDESWVEAMQEELL
nr:retrovirus-related Pol polyprotein from transposon TNT 1-94 [Tanacetum cinerariifolium]